MMNGPAYARAIPAVAAIAILTACAEGPAQSGTSAPPTTASPTASPTTSATATASPTPSAKPKKSAPNAGGGNVEANAVDFGSGLADEWRFEDVEVGASQSHGGAFFATQKIVITSVVFRSSAGDFALTRDTCSGATLSPTSGCSWAVTYTRISADESPGADLSLTGTRDGVESSWGIVFSAGALAETSEPSPSVPAEPPADESPPPLP